VPPALFVERREPRCGFQIDTAFDAFEPHLAGMGEDGRAVAFDMLIEPDAGAGLGQDRCERDLADLKRITPTIVAVPPPWRGRGKNCLDRCRWC